MKKKMLALLLTAAMVVSVTACGGNSDSPSSEPQSQEASSAAPESSQAAPESSQAAAPTEEDDGTLMADVNTQDAIDVEAESEASDALYDEIFGEYVEYYEKALSVGDQGERLGLMAIAEAKLLETGVVLPYQNNAGNYAISRIIPRYGATVSWGMDGDYRVLKSALIADRILLPEERAAFTAKWSECETADEYIAYVKQWCEDNGVTLQNTYTTTYTSGYEPDVWDTLSTNKTAVGGPLSFTWEGLLAYDAKNIQQPALAESWEKSEDGTVYTFHIRPGMKWVTYQGTEIADVKADDWVAAVQHAADCGGDLSSVISPIVNLDEYVSGDITDFNEVGIKALDDYTLEVTLKEMTPWFETVLGYSAMAPMCREYYVSQGGKFGAEFDSSAADYTYGSDPQHIAYCGPYLISNWTYQNTIAYTKNPSYWNTDNVTLDTITYIYNDGTDPLFAWNAFLDGTLNGGIGLGSAALEQAKAVTVPDDPDGKTYFEKYAYVVLEDDTSFLNWVNVNRYAYANFNDESVMRSPQTVTQAQRTAAAKLNHNFRMALTYARDRGTSNAASVGEELKYASLTNSYVPGSFIVAADEFTVDINGTATTFPAGTFYGEVLQAQLTADGYPITVWDPEGNDGAGASYGFDGWYMPDEAAKCMDAAVEELAAQGIEVSAENPIYLDWCYRDYSPIGSAMDQAMKQSIEDALGGRVVVNLVSSEGDSNNVSYAAYMGDFGYQFNFDFGGSSGWGPDYGDAQTYLDTMLPTGGMMQNVGLW